MGSSITSIKPSALRQKARRTRPLPSAHPAAPPAVDEASPAPPPERAVSRPASRPPRRGRRTALGVGVLLVLTVALAGWRYGAPRPADLLQVTPGPFARELRGPGTLDAIHKASVSAAIQGVLTSVRVDIGDKVKAGDVVATLVADDLKAQEAAAVASHHAAVKAVLLAEADLSKARAALDNARLVLDRQKKLMTTGSTTQSSLDAAEMTHAQAVADIARMDAAISQAKATEAAAKASAEASAAQLEKSTIRAPMDGLVVARALNVGDLVVPGTAIVEVVDPKSVVLSARFDESIISKVSLGQSARLSFSGPDSHEAGHEIGGTVRRLGREVDTETREFVVDIAPRALPRNWAIGQRGTATLILDPRPDVLTVPLAAIARRGADAGVFALRDGRAYWRPVETGGLGDTRVEVRAGLSPGDIILARPKDAYGGMPVALETRAP